MVKLLVKKIFPIIFLKKLFLIYNKIKINTVDALFFSQYIFKQEEIILEESKNPFLELNIDLSKFPQSIQRGFSRWCNPAWTQDQYIVKLCKPVLIEPKSGWGIFNKRKLIYYSLGFSRAPYVPKPSIFVLLFGRKKTRYLPSVISLRDTGEENYFHFYNDVLSKLIFLQAHLPSEMKSHIVVSDRLWNKKYFQFYLQNTWLKELNWHIQTDEWIKTDEVVFCKPFTHTVTHLTALAAMVKIPMRKTRMQKIFLTRHRNSLRFIENEDEIFFILMKYGFEKVDASVLSFEDQVSMFSSVSDVVAVHGAGISNIIFKQNGPLRLLELFHDYEYLPFHYIMLAHMLRFDYFAIEGMKSSQHSRGGFRIDPRKIEEYCATVFN